MPRPPEVVGSVCFAGLAVVFADGSVALAVVGGALVAKHVLETLIARRHEDVFARDGVSDEIGALWVTQALAFGIANVDYLLVGITLGPSAFSVYSIAYRLAVAVPATVAFVASRNSVAEMASVDDPLVRERRYGRYVTPLFVVGAAAALAVAVCAPVLAGLLGQQWTQVGPTAAVLAIALPWRMIVGQAGALAITGGNTRRLVRWEVERLLGFRPRLLARILLRLLRLRRKREHLVDRGHHLAAPNRGANRRHCRTVVARAGRRWRVRACR